MTLNNFIRQRSRNYVIVVCICLLITLTMLGGCTSTRNEKAEKVRQGMTAYLQDRYGIEFEVGKPYLTGSMSTTHYQAKAHPKGKPEIEFIISDNSYMDEMGSGVYTDYYLEAKWSYQGRQEVKKKLREVYGEEADLYISRYEFTGGGYVFKDLDYAQVFEKSHSKGRLYLLYAIFTDGSQFDKDVEAQKAYQIMLPFVLDYGSNNYNFSVVYVDKAAKQDFLDNPQPYIWNNRKAYHEKKLLNLLLVNYPLDSSAIKDCSDLVKFFEY